MIPPIDLSNVTLRTERLILRPWRMSDLDDLYEYASVEGVGEMAGWPHHTDKEVSRTILQNFINEKKTFALEYEGKVIGSLGVERYAEQKYPELAGLRCREIGYVLSRDYWGKGLMPEAVREVIRWLFEEQGLDAILCGHFNWNAQSARVQEKCGFRHYGNGVYRTHMDTEEPETVNILTREDWLAQREGA